MSRRNTISREFFATIAAVLVLGLSVMCAIQTALSAAYFISERKSSLTDVLNGATALSERFADEGSIVTKPLQDDDIMERAHSGFELFNTASGARAVKSPLPSRRAASLISSIGPVMRRASTQHRMLHKIRMTAAEMPNIASISLM